ncbi:MAG: cbb3-type cytochrome c oxidase subunit I, partial [Verrucomicrobiota bacterium]
NSLLLLWFVPIGLAASYYLIPKVVGRAIFSYQLALGGFWMFAILGAWTGIQKYMGGPLPSWMPSVSGAASILLLIPVTAIAINHHRTVKGSHHLIGQSPTLRFTFFGAIAFNLFALVGALLSFFSIGGAGQFSHAQAGFQMLGLYGFFTMAMFGAIYFILPRLVKCEWVSAKWINTHFWLSSYGVIAMIGCLLFGGLSQGREMNALENEFLVSVEVASGYLVGRSLAWVFIIIANLIFFFHVLLMVLRLGPPSGEPTLLHHEESAEESLPTAQVSQA